MAGINFLYNNLVDNAVLSVDSGGENAQYPLLNLKNSSPSNKFRSLTATSVVIIDLLSNQTVDTISLKGDPLGELGVLSASFRYSNTLDFTSSPVINVTLSSEHNAGLEFFTAVDARYWEMTLSGASYVELGVLYIGEKLNIPQQNYSISSFQYKYNDNSTVNSNQYGQRFINSRNLQKSLSGKIEYATSDETELLDNMSISVGRSQPLWVIVDENSDAISDGKFRFMIYGYLNQLPIWSATGGQTFNGTFSVKEAT